MNSAWSRMCKEASLLFHSFTWKLDHLNNVDAGLTNWT